MCVQWRKRVYRLALWQPPYLHAILLSHCTYIQHTLMYFCLFAYYTHTDAGNVELPSVHICTYIYVYVIYGYTLYNTAHARRTAEKTLHGKEGERKETRMIMMMRRMMMGKAHGALSRTRYTPRICAHHIFTGIAHTEHGVVLGREHQLTRRIWASVRAQTHATADDADGDGARRRLFHSLGVPTASSGVTAAQERRNWHVAEKALSRTHSRTSWYPIPRRGVYIPYIYGPRTRRWGVCSACTTSLPST